MKYAFLVRGLALTVLASLALTAQATSVPIVTQGSNGASTQGTSGSLVVPATCSVSSYVQITVSYSGGGGVSVWRNGVTVLSFSIGSNNPGTYSKSDAVYNQPAGTYSYSQGFGGPPNSVYGYIQTTFNW